MTKGLWAALAAGLAIFGAPAMAAEPPPITVDAAAAVHLPAMTVPFSNLASPQAKADFLNWMDVKAGWDAQSAKAKDYPALVATYRANYVNFYTPLLAKARAAYPTNIESQTIAGVYTDVVTPKAGVAARNAHRVLIDLHSGGMTTGARILGKLEAVPIAGVGRIKVVAIDYRQGPEFKFPAASEDVAAVYRELLKTYKPQDIGIYGCSAGGLLTAAVIPWFKKVGLPRPGAIGVMCAGATGWQDGDSSLFFTALDGNTPLSVTPRWSVSDAPYFSAVDIKDPLVAPGWSPAVLATFPPTFFVSGTRDVAMSSAIFSHTQLLKQGVHSELYLWDGMNHDFIADVGLPESVEAYNLIWTFFDRHLGVN
jgi:acetyl esterase/lipase